MNPGTFEWMRQWRMHLQQAYEHNERLLQRVEELEARIQRMERKLDQHQPIRIETINYKVQELHVQELSGTLVAGLSALADGEAVKKWLGEDGVGGVKLSDLESSVPGIPEEEGHAGEGR